jgi:hypothetical protein
VSIVANLLYTWHQFYISTTGIYGSGLTNGFSPVFGVVNPIGTPGTVNYQPGTSQYCTGLFCFNDAYHVHPSYIQQLAVGYTFIMRRMWIKPEFFMDNMWDAYYALKGAFYSGPSVGRPRSFTGKVSIGV